MPQSKGCKIVRDSHLKACILSYLSASGHGVANADLGAEFVGPGPAEAAALVREGAPLQVCSRRWLDMGTDGNGWDVGQVDSPFILGQKRQPAHKAARR